MENDFWAGEAGLILLKGWARNGFTRAQIAKKMKLSTKKLLELESGSETAKSALGMGREETDLAVEEALLEKAMKGDVRACVYWLKNRRPEAWADKPPVGGKGFDGDSGHLEVLAEMLRSADEERDIEEFL